MLNSLDVARICAEAADSKKGLDVLILDLRKLTYIADYFVICSGSNITQVGAIADGIGEALAGDGIRPSHIEGGADSTWILMDCSDVVVHVFEESTRIFYGLEKLWGDAPKVHVREVNRRLQGASS